MRGKRKREETNARGPAEEDTTESESEETSGEQTQIDVLDSEEERILDSEEENGDVIFLSSRGQRPGHETGTATTRGEQILDSEEEEKQGGKHRGKRKKMRSTTATATRRRSTRETTTRPRPRRPTSTSTPRPRPRVAPRASPSPRERVCRARRTTARIRSPYTVPTHRHTPHGTTVQKSENTYTVTTVWISLASPHPSIHPLSRPPRISIGVERARTRGNEI